MTDVAYGSYLPPQRLPRWISMVSGLAFAVAALVALTLVFAGPDTYRDIARGRGQVSFAVPASQGRAAVRLVSDEATLVELHRETLGYVLAERSEPARCCDGRPLFDDAERSHLADVRAVFSAVRVAALVALASLVALLWAVSRRGGAAILRVIRDGAVLAAVLVALLGIVAGVAFEPAFLAFHYVFFPQGNFLFDPATSNLLRLYPEEYWYGVTLRIGIAFVAIATIVAAAATIALRAATRSASRR